MIATKCGVSSSYRLLKGQPLVVKWSLLKGATDPGRTAPIFAPIYPFDLSLPGGSVPVCPVCWFTIKMNGCACGRHTWLKVNGRHVRVTAS